MENKYVLAFDFGASSGRAILAHLENDKIIMEEVHRFSNDPVFVGNTMYWDTLRQFYEIKQGIVKAKQKAKFESIGIDTWGVDFGLLNEHGELLENAVHYRDDRTLNMQQKVFSSFPKDKIYNITGIQFENFNTIFQLFALKTKRPWLINQAKTMLLTPDLFNYLLTGEKKAEYTIASTTQLLDAKNKTWSDEIIDNLSLSKELFPDIVSSGTIIGNIKPEICNELGIDKTKVIAVASHDTQSAVVAVPTTEDDFIFISCGTWSLFGTELNEPIINDKAFDLNISNEGGFNQSYNLLKNIIGLWLIQESRRYWISQGKEYSFAELDLLASQAPELTCFIDPDSEEFNTAGDIPSRIQEFCKRTNQKPPETIGEIVRCIHQSLAMKYRYTLEQIENCTGKTFSAINMLGGGIQSKLLCQMTANASGKKVITGPTEATALGNILVQFMALGEVKDIKHARQIVINSENLSEYTPKDNELWDNAYVKFKEILRS